MILGVMSDTHGNRKLMHQVAGLMEAALEVTVILHLGDEFTDAQELAMAGHEVRMVPGLWCEAYHNARIPKRLVEEFDGLKVAMAHADRDLRHTERAAAIILTGHTHSAVIHRIGTCIYMNPGHLKRHQDRNEDASFGTIAINNDTVRCAIHDISGGVRDELTALRNQLA
ncbi:MAG: metallophosphoesterase family protein [Candidatus Hydrogenedentes bacterium]|nr:metallophosphoesterase family protein [Candidatus Hydrogenedentota bacterium]